MIFAIIENEIVVNTIVADKDFVESNYEEAVEITNEEVSIGFTYKNKKFSPPKPFITTEDDLEA